MDQSYLKNLELEKIIARAAEYCVCREAKQLLLNEQPMLDADEVRYALAQTNAVIPSETTEINRNANSIGQPILLISIASSGKSGILFINVLPSSSTAGSTKG